MFPYRFSFNFFFLFSFKQNKLIICFLFVVWRQECQRVNQQGWVTLRQQKSRSTEQKVKMTRWTSATSSLSTKATSTALGVALLWRLLESISHVHAMCHCGYWSSAPTCTAFSSFYWTILSAASLKFVTWQNTAENRHETNRFIYLRKNCNLKIVAFTVRSIVLYLVSLFDFLVKKKKNHLNNYLKYI